MMSSESFGKFVCVTTWDHMEESNCEFKRTHIRFAKSHVAAYEQEKAHNEGSSLIAEDRDWYYRINVSLATD